MTDVVRVHSILVWVLVGLTVFMALRLRREGAAPLAQKAVVLLLVAEIAQGAIGYTQYFTGVPPLLVGFHIVGALAVWIAALRVRIALG
jgi:cytochrome c oxidase assembly protein subunit 15